MYIVELQYNVKPGADIDEGLRLYKEVALSIYRKTPGLRFNAIYKYESIGSESPEWDYVYLEVWESKEAHDKALGVYIGRGTNSELARTGYYEKILPMIGESSIVAATLLASSE